MATNSHVQAPKRRPKGSARAVESRSAWLTPRRLLVLVGIGAVVVAGALIGVSMAGSSGSSSGAKVAGAAATQALLGGIQQHGNVLGSPIAPVTLVEFADPACPYCRAFTLGTLPALVDGYVRPGKVRIVFDGLRFVGPASDGALRAAEAAGAQDKLWNVLDLMYRNQGNEQTNWATDSFLRSVGGSVPGLGTALMMDERSSPAVNRAIQSARTAALMADVTQTPSFQVGLTGGTLRALPITTLDLSAFAPTIDRLLGQ